MITSHLSQIATIVALALSPILCHAQQSDQVSLQFVSFPKSENTEALELIVGENKTVLVELPTNSLSKVYKVNRNSKWTLGKTVVGDDGKSSFATYGETPSNTSNSQIILVIRSGVEDKDGLTLSVIDSDPTALRGGSYLFINCSKTKISGEIGDTKIELAPSNHSLVNPKPNEAGENADRLLIHILLNKGEDASPFLSSTWRFNEKARSVVFIYQTPDTNHLRIHTIRDYIP